MANLNEAPYLIQSRYVLCLQAIQSIIQGVGSLQQVPCAVNLAIACCLLQHQTLLAHSFEPSNGSEERMMLQSFQCFRGGKHGRFHSVRGSLYSFNALAQFLIPLAYLMKCKFQKAVFLRVVRLYLLLNTIEVSWFHTMFCQFVLNVMGSLLQFVGSQIYLLTMKSMARAVYDTFASFYEFLLLSLKHAPPNDVGMFTVLVGREAMKRATHVVQRQHAVFSLNVFHDGTPMLMIVELCTQDFKTETESPCFFVYLVYYLYLASSYLILVVDEASQDMPTEGEAVVVILQDGTKLSVFHIVLELNPYWIVSIVEECGRSRNALLDVCLMVGIQCPLYRHDSF